LPVHTGKRTSPEKIIKATRPKPDPVQLRRQKLPMLALRIWGRVRDIPDLAEDEPLHDVVGMMDAQLVQGLTAAIPKAQKFLQALGKELHAHKKK